MSLSTPLSERIGVRYPFMQAGMGGIGPITLARLAAAISEAGALGTIAPDTAMGKGDPITGPMQPPPPPAPNTAAPTPSLPGLPPIPNLPAIPGLTVPAPQQGGAGR